MYTRRWICTTALVWCVVLLSVVSGDNNAVVPEHLCCEEISFDAVQVRPGRTVSDNTLNQEPDGSPWIGRWKWWMQVVEREPNSGEPYQVGGLLLNETGGTPTVTGRDLLISTTLPSTRTGLTVFNSFPSQLREGTTNYRWRATDSAPETWLKRLRIHRSITAEHPTSVRLESRRSDGSLMTRTLWLWTSDLVLNTIEWWQIPSTANGPLGEFTISVWGSGYAAIATVEMCQACVEPSPSVSPTPSHSMAPTRSPSAPPALGSACDTGQPGVCAAGTWQRSTQGTLVCTLDTLPYEEICDGLDNDCDGQVDEDFIGRTTTCGVGVCQRTVPLCSADGPTQCRPGEPEQPNDPCDGLDNNCDGQVDEDSHVVSCGVGACRRTIDTCSSDGVPQECVPGEPTQEVCDGVDNNCNGLVDEDNVCQHPDFAVTRRGVLLSGACLSDDLSTGHVCLVNTDDKNVASDVVVELLHSYKQGDQWTSPPIPVGALQTVDVRIPLSGVVGDAVAVVDQTQQRALFDANTPPCRETGYASWCSGDGNSTIALYTREEERTSVMTPIVDTCVQRLDGYCNMTLGYYYSGATPLTVPIDPSANQVVASSGIQLEQNQPTTFWPGRVRDVLYVRTACPTAEWQDGSWFVAWSVVVDTVRRRAQATPISECGLTKVY